MAAKKKAASASDAVVMVVGFATGNYSAEDAGVNLTTGQMVELAKETFDDLASHGYVEPGVFVKMKTAVEGKRYSLKPHDTTWLPSHVYQAWKAAGYCEPSPDDPEVTAVLKARDEAARDAVAERDVALTLCGELQVKLQEAVLNLQVARAGAVKVLEIIQPDPDANAEPDAAAAALLAEVTALVGMFPEFIEDQTTTDTAPELDLS